MVEVSIFFAFNEALGRLTSFGGLLSVFLALAFLPFALPAEQLYCISLRLVAGKDRVDCPLQ